MNEYTNIEPEWNHGPDEDDAIMLGLREPIELSKNDNDWIYNKYIMHILNITKFFNKTRSTKVEYANNSTCSI